MYVQGRLTTFTVSAGTASSGFDNHLAVAAIPEIVGRLVGIPRYAAEDEEHGLRVPVTLPPRHLDERRERLFPQRREKLGIARR